jgi:hypothetical protein
VGNEASDTELSVVVQVAKTFDEEKAIYCDGN